MTATNTFFDWFLFHGLSGLGGWFLFFLIALAATIWLYYDSAIRRLPAIGWRLGITLAALLVLPAALYRFTVSDIADAASSPLGQYGEAIFYLGVLGGVLPVVLAIGYYVTFQGLVTCPQGHLYEARMGKCPHPDHIPNQEPQKPSDRPEEEPPDSMRPPQRDIKNHVNAWLITKDQRRNYQLCVEETRIGRSARKNDIVLEGDQTVSRESAKIVEQNGRFRLIPLTDSRFLRLNNSAIRQPVLLQPNDEIQFGEDTILRFVCPQ